jgi:hypothetical protein
MRTLIAVLWAACIWLVAAGARAHVVDLSQSDFTVSGASVHALVVFAKRDAVRLGAMDPDHDGTVTPAELEASRAAFRELAEREVTVIADGARCAPALEGGGDVEGDGFGLSIDFTCAAPPREIEVSMDVLRRLPPGHRHVLRLLSGDETEEAVLTREHPGVRLTIFAATIPAAPAVPWSAVRLGVEHILTGWDHLLFLFALLLGTRGIRPIALAVSAFTVAHSITLALAATGIFLPSSRIVEPAIALSIAYVAFANVWRPGAPDSWRAALVFGLVHGFGFAAALRDLALPRERLLPTLLAFNAGVEIGQLLVVLALAPSIAFVLTRRGSGAASLRAASIVLGIVGVAIFVARIARASRGS